MLILRRELKRGGLTAQNNPGQTQGLRREWTTERQEFLGALAFGKKGLFRVSRG